jgi:predicted  nucleic acid-binding Zn-ribbon protein
MDEKKNGFEKKVLDNLDRINKKLIDNDKRFDKVDGRFEKIDGTLMKISNKLIDRDDRFEKLEIHLKDFMLTHFDKIYKTLEDLKQEYHVLNAAVKRLEEKVDRLEKVSKEEIDSIKKQIISLLSRIEKLESKVGV